MKYIIQSTYQVCYYSVQYLHNYNRIEVTCWTKHCVHYQRKDNSYTGYVSYTSTLLLYNKLHFINTSNTDIVTSEFNVAFLDSDQMSNLCFGTS